MDKQLTPEENKIKCPSCGIWYSDQQTATLQARVVELEEKNKTLTYLIDPATVLKIADYEMMELRDKNQEKENNKLKSRISELERERNELGSNRIAVGRRLISSQQLNETLMGLLESMFHLAHDHETGQSDWQSYKQEHGLQSPENPAP